MERPKNSPETKGLLESWPEELPTEMLFSTLDANGAPVGEGYPIRVTDEGVDLSQLPDAARESFVIGGLPDDLGNRVRPTSNPKGFITALLRQASRRWHIKIIV